jgi:uncharacterized protein YecE (DUF72 family)
LRADWRGLFAIVMKFFVGTSGYSYNAWKGSFYPEKLPQKEMLSYYAQRFAAVEINSTFYRMPQASVLKDWAAEVPKAFQFAFKAPGLITHRKRLKNAKQETDDVLRTLKVLKDKLGPVLFQLPPNFKKDLPRLESFLKSIRGKVRVAFEFRHPSWFDDEVYDCLRAKSCALCLADVDDAPTPNLVRTAGWGYLRLRRRQYTAKTLEKWIEKIRDQKWRQVYVFFKHEETGTGPKFATRFLKAIDS